MNFKRLLAIPALIVGLLVIFHLSRSIVGIYRSGGRAEGLRAEVAGLREEKKELEEEKAFRESLEFVEREARDKLRMVREGEHILVLPGGQDEQIRNSKFEIRNDEEEPNWKKWVEFWFD